MWVDGAGSSYTLQNQGLAIVGVNGSGSLLISGGATASQGYINIAADAGSTGTATVTGAGTMCTVSIVYAGNGGNGTFAIKNGAVVNSSLGFVANQAGSTGTVSVDGAGSNWTLTGQLSVGGPGNGAMTISNDASVTVQYLSVGVGSVLSVDVGRGSSLATTGTSHFEGVTNSGTVRLTAASGAVPGVYTPISCSTLWSGTGTYQALGGTWNATNHTFTVAASQTGTSGNGVTIDTSVNQQVVITAPSGHTVEAGFQGTTTAAQLTFTATTMTSGTLSGLETLLGSSSSVMAGWQFLVTGSGYTSGDPVYLSMDIGSGLSTDDLEIWHFDGTNWTPYTTTDFSYDGTNANFTVTGFSGYAVVETPEPATMILLGIGSGLVLLRRRRAV